MENKTYLGLLSQQVKETITTDSVGGGVDLYSAEPQEAAGIVSTEFFHLL